MYTQSKIATVQEMANIAIMQLTGMIIPNTNKIVSPNIISKGTINPINSIDSTNLFFISGVCLLKVFTYNSFQIIVKN